MRYLKLLVLLVLVFIPAANALSFYVPEEDINVLVNGDASLDISYELDVTTTSGLQHGIFFSVPTDDTEILSIEDGSGKQLEYSFADVDVLKIYFSAAQSKGQSTKLNIKLKSPRMVFERGGEAAVRFVPAWFDQETKNLKLTLTLPKTTENFTASPVPTSNYAENNKTTLFWQIPEVHGNQRLEFLVTFPKSMVNELYAERLFREELGLTGQDHSWLLWPVLFVVIISLFFAYKIKF